MRRKYFFGKRGESVIFLVGVEIQQERSSVKGDWTRLQMATVCASSILYTSN